MGRNLLVAHYHLRPGGVRRVLETALPAIAGAGRMDSVTLATGEEPDPVWLQRLGESLRGTPLHVLAHPGFFYVSGWKHPQEHSLSGLTDFCRRSLADTGDGNTILWIHNAALGRNLPATLAWSQAAKDSGAVVVSHHHDFFFDNRWHLWPEIEATGFASPSIAAEAALAAGARTVHVAINTVDLAGLRAGFGARAAWIPNPSPLLRHSQRDEKNAAAWLAARTASDGPVWILPSRILRRKNVAEALLLGRWLRPEAVIATTGGASSEHESAYARRLAETAGTEGWSYAPAILAAAEDSPPVSAFLAAAETVLMTSLQEGFGLPCLEAASAARPLFARILPNVSPDLDALGFHTPLAYADVRVPSDFFHARREAERRIALWSRWRSGLPPAIRSRCEPPAFPASPNHPVAFSRLTLEAQLEVLSHSPAEIHAALAPFNPNLAAWRGLPGRLPPATLGDSAKTALSPEQFAASFQAAVDLADSAPAPPVDAPQKALDFFLAGRLAAENLYPLLLETGPGSAGG
jgi:hypothetical protein